MHAAAAQAPAVAPPPPIRAASAILVDAVSGQVLYEKNADAPRPPASTTKIMTAILLLEHTHPQDVITASKRCADTEGSSLHLRPGEKITAHDLLYGLVLRSANDGCVAAAEAIAGSEGQFAQMMTAKAREIGAMHTIFRNPNGLNDPPNTTTARDLALMARYALRYPAFQEAVSTPIYRITRSMDTRDVILRNHSIKWLAHFPGADGIKTGYTVPAGHCFVGSATWNGWRLISVVLHSPDAFGETSALMKWGFYHFEPRVLAQAGRIVARVPVQGGQEASVPAAPEAPVQVVVPKGVVPDAHLQVQTNTVEAPVAPGAQLGRVAVVWQGRTVSSVPLIATASDPRRLPPGRAAHSWIGPGILVLFGTALIGYGRAVAKSARRRRSGLSARFRETDFRR
ncbi:MAG: D-alanyl-D-alanine carboxypeptidase family protein [Chthonomonadales bacterium]